MNYCSHCGAPVSLKVPPGDNLPRHVCDRCGTIHYQNPKVVVGALATWGDKILMCKRAIEPRYRCWTLPAGFMELDETTAEGAGRETVEESGAEFDMGPLFGVMNVPRVGQVHVFYLCQLRHDRFAPGTETMEARLFAEDEIPWEEIAFLTVRHILQAYFEDRRQGVFGVHTMDFSVKDFPPERSKPAA